jgi:hypothetical protein
MPHFKRTKVEKVKREGFEESDFRRLIQHLYEHVRQAELDGVAKRESINPRVIHQRKLLALYVQFMSYTGARVGEIRYLRFSDLVRIEPLSSSLTGDNSNQGYSCQFFEELHQLETKGITKSGDDIYTDCLPNKPWRNKDD